MGGPVRGWPGRRDKGAVSGLVSAGRLCAESPCMSGVRGNGPDVPTESMELTHTLCHVPWSLKASACLPKACFLESPQLIQALAPWAHECGLASPMAAWSRDQGVAGPVLCQRGVSGYKQGVWARDAAHAARERRSRLLGRHPGLWPPPPPPTGRLPAEGLPDPGKSTFPGVVAHCPQGSCHLRHRRAQERPASWWGRTRCSGGLTLRGRAGFYGSLLGAFVNSHH